MKINIQKERCDKMKRIKTTIRSKRLIAMVMAFALTLSIMPAFPAGAYQLGTEEILNINTDSFTEEVLQPDNAEPRSIEVLKTLDGITFGEDGSVVAVKVTEENGITSEEMELLLLGETRGPEDEHAPVYNGYYALGLTDKDIEQAIRLHGDANAFSLEIVTYNVSIEDLAPDKIFEEDILSLICSGYTCGEAFGAYASSSILGLTIKELAAARVEEIEEELEKAEMLERLHETRFDETAEEEQDYELLELSTRLGVPYKVVEDFMQDYGGTAEDLKAEYSAVREETYEEMQVGSVASGTVRDSGISASSASGGTVRDSRISTSSASGETSYYPSEILDKPYTYDTVGSMDINVNTGEQLYTETDLSISGVNGLDLNITRVFNSEYSNAQTPAGIVYGSNTSCVVLKYLWFIQYTDSDGNVQYEDVTNQGYTALYDPIDPLGMSKSSSLYLSASDYANGTALACKAILEEDCYNSAYLGRNPYGLVWLYFRPVLVAISGTYESYFFSNPISYEYTLNEFGLGNGWRLGFSSIETYAEFVLNEAIVKRRLITSDGRRYEIEGNIGSNTSAQTSNLVDYPLLDMRLFMTGNGYPNAYYSLFHQDGRIEYFDSNGRNIAIVDRHGNAITLDYTYTDSSKRVVSGITVTDTMGNVVIYENENIDSSVNYYVSVKSQGNTSSIRYNTKWTLSLNGSTIKTYYSYDTRNKTGSFGKSCSTLNVVEDELGDRTIIYYANSSYKYDSFVSTLSTNAGDMYKCFIYILIYPNGLELTRDSYGLTGLKSLGGGGCIRYPKNFSIELNRTDYLSSEFESYKAHMYLIGNHSGYSQPEAADYYSEVSECKLFSLSATSTALIPVKRDLYAFSVETHLKDSVVTRNYTPFDEFSINSIEDLYATPIPQLLSKEIETTYTYHSTYKLPTQISTKYYNPGSSTVMRTSVNKYTYDNRGNVLTATSPDNQTTTYAYDSTYYLPLTVSYKKDAATTVLITNVLSTNKKNIVTTTATENGVTVGKSEYAYASDGRVTSQKNYSTSTEYNELNYAYGSVSALPEEIKTLNVKDADGSAVTGSPGCSAGVVSTKVTYNSRGWPLTATDGNGNTTTISYDAAGNITRVTNPDGTYASYTYDVANRSVTYTDELGSSFKYIYDVMGNQIEIIDLGSGQTSLERVYGCTNRLYSETVYDGLGNSNTTICYYDNFGRSTEISTKDPNGNILYKESYAYQFVSDTQYTNGLFITTKTVLGDTNAPSVVTTAYSDAMGNTVKTGRYLNNTEYFDAYTYDYLGNVLTETTAYASQKGLSYSTKWEYDYAGRVVKAYNADGGYSTAAYDWLGNTVSATDFKGSQTQYSYDALGRLLIEKVPIEQSGSTVIYSTTKYYYDATGNVVSQMTSNNQAGAADTWSRVDFAYDSRSRLTSSTLYNGASVDSVTRYGYDGVGNMLTVTTGLSSLTAADGEATSYTYGRYGNVLTLTDPLGQTETYTYSALGVLTGGTDRNGNVTSYTYDALGRVTGSSVSVKSPKRKPTAGANPQRWV